MTIAERDVAHCRRATRTAAGVERSGVRPTCLGTVPRVLPRAGGRLLGVHLSDPDGHRAGNRVSRSAGGADQRRRRVGTAIGGGCLGTRIEFPVCRRDVRPALCAAAAADRQDAVGRFRRRKSGRLPLPFRSLPTGKRAGANAVDDALERTAGRVDRLKTSDETVSEPGGRYVDFLVPGLLGMSLMAGGLWGVGFVTVDMRIRKLVKRFLATPMKKRDFLAATMVSRMLFMIPEVLVLLVFAALRVSAYCTTGRCGRWSF